MGDNSGDEDGGGVDGDAFRGHFPVPAACRNRDSCPPNLGFAMAAALEGFSYRGLFPRSFYVRKAFIGGESESEGVWAARQQGRPPWAAPPPCVVALGLSSGPSPVFWKLRGIIRYWALISSNSENISLLGFLKPKTAENRNWHFGISSIDSGAVFTNPPPLANDTCDTAGSVRDDDADHDAFINAAVEEARAPPVNRSTGGFADEDDLFDLFRSFGSYCNPADQVSTASSLSKGKDIPLTVAAATPPSGKTDLRGVISSLEAFASQFTSLEADKVRLQREVNSSSMKLEGANKIAAATRQEVDSLKEELSRLKEKLKEEEASRLVAEARVTEKDELLCQSSLALLAADIPADALDKVPNNSAANSVSMTLAAHQLTRELLDKGKGAMARMHSMIFPKISQDKTLGQLIDAFAVDTKEVIEVFPVPAFVDDSSGALSEDDRIQRMKDRIAQMEKDLRNTYALAAIVRKKGEIAADVERYALTELHKATESLNFIALNRAEENKRIHERVNALTQLSSAEEIFWREHSKASAVAQFQDRVQQVHHFFDKCYKALRETKRGFPITFLTRYRSGGTPLHFASPRVTRRALRAVARRGLSQPQL
ncbi:hypothetical protein QYE76_028373 [Lolium multiflorum]|uniref:Uncharacterized protein n=1 Tax=Lolium multiflorum TaxID=4521 RepID=A0AAD8VH94_LOLMU|nr:hypothetical protein QYE76_028373 [Lolium multiflorum]